jgi:hypothetical protein
VTAERAHERWSGRAGIAAILIEALWATLAAAIAYKTLKDWPLDLRLLGEATAAAALFGVAVLGLRFGQSASGWTIGGAG